MIYRRSVLSIGIAVSFVLTACGGSDSASDTTVETVATTEAETEPTEEFTLVEDDAVDDTTSTSAPTETTVATETTAAVTTAAGSTAGGADAAASVAEVSMVEWEIDAPTEYVAGEVTFTATNNGSFPHEFVVIRGDGYESLPLEAGGAVIEDELPAGALLDRTERIAGGTSADLTVTLEAGNYVLVCNLGGGTSSHAGRGQNLDISVS
ncbi:hypothetical protein [Ilumatobacter sp.]|uniref:hypothetical protein n=1 Tax=Ilumatobacter sp. TaxID=1967498 RepID=UPI003C56A0D1